jgi:hypothetical protein
MKIFKMTLLIIVLALSSCQSIPIERKSKCACAWKEVNTQSMEALV